VSAPRLLALVWMVATFAAAGCALTSKSDPLLPRYFSPERHDEVASPAPAGNEPAGELKLGRIEGASHLDERLVFRDSANELGYYAERRWTEEPDEYLQRRLTRVLFEQRRLRHVVGGAAATLDVHLEAFEEVRAPKRVARVQVKVTLRDARLVLWEETLTIEQPVGAVRNGDVADAVVTALGESLRIAVDRIADGVVRELAAVPAPASEQYSSESAEP
jgi:cholesterol transport system auxiliary component